MHIMWELHYICDFTYHFKLKRGNGVGFRLSVSCVSICFSNVYFNWCRGLSNSYRQVSPELHSPIGTPVQGITLFILLRAFASGSSALTGVEAISNAIPNFKEPAPKNAAKTLMMMGVLLADFYRNCHFSLLFRNCTKYRGNRCFTNC